MAAAMVFWLAGAAHAHFLFVRICPPAEGGRAAEVYFSEYAAAGDPRFIDKVATAQFWIQRTPGEFRPLAMQKLSDRLRAHVPLDGTLLVAGQWDYGVRAVPGQAPFLLRHYSKAVAGQPDEINQLKPKGTRLEVVASFDGDRVVLTALLDGQPLAGAKFTAVDSDLVDHKLEGNADGQATFTPPAASVYSIYTSHVDATSGEQDGKSYREVREFATLAFTWPLVSHEADPEAVKLFEGALAARAVWQDFPGFTAKVGGEVEGRPFSGEAKVAADGSVALELDEEPLAEWVQEQLESITMHRAAGQAPSAEGPRPVLRFADDRVDHPLGRLLAFEGGHFATSYRVKDDQITSVNRVLDGQNMTIRVLDNERNAEGKFLPRSYTVQYWDEATGRLERTESVHDRWTRVDKWDLPLEHTVTAASRDGFSVRSLRVTEHQMAR
jgi:hypothetical protein